MDDPSKEELRKLQLTGGSTYIVSLPKNWVEKVGLKRGSIVSIKEMDDLTLCVQPREAEIEQEIRRANVTVSDEMMPEDITRRVISAYLVGFNIIHVRNHTKRIAPDQRFMVKDFTRKKLVGTEILSDLPQELTLQVLLSHTELSVTDALRRMSIISASMHRDSLNTLRTNSQLAKEIIAMDDEVDRFGLYIIRLLKAGVNNIQILREIGLRSPRESLGYRLITKSVERMADHAVNIAQNSLALNLSELDEEIIEELEKLSNTVIRVFEDAIEALFNGDYESAEIVMGKAGIARQRETELVQKIVKSSSPGDVSALRLILESILRTAEYGADVAEVVLNMTIEDEIREN
jgi:phosphate uptake regulator